ncbi:hypothetical protein K466DRAFT_604311 [Polyporus arcularius HHB13444]|uniref:Uncharacterized protein n=1 Tax=Polyporus arcularius HHB13444 TaxID=1314778 RepID=A0A5C3NW33_9APHY|nr:hypothetical protein K466DRAFT_604311 [Polyporus arcularius HHB13444]
MDEFAAIVLLRELVRIPLHSVLEGFHRMLLMDIQLRSIEDVVRPHVRWIEVTVPSPRQHTAHPAHHRVIERPGVVLHVPPNVLHEPLIVVVDRLRGVNLRFPFLLSISFYEVLLRGRPRLRVNVDSSVLGNSSFAYGDATSMVDLYGTSEVAAHRGCGDSTMDSEDESSDDEGSTVQAASVDCSDDM